MRKKNLSALALGSGIFVGAFVGVLGVQVGLSPAHAHGTAEPGHGGTVQSAGDLSFELVPQADRTAIYIDDHGKPLPLAGVTGKLTVLTGTAKSESALAVVGDKLEAPGVKLVAGSKAVASVTTADKKTLTVRFSVK